MLSAITDLATRQPGQISVTDSGVTRIRC